MAGSTTQLHAYLTDSTRRVSEITTLVSWTSSNPNIATVSAAGVLSGASAGTAVVAARYEGMATTREIGIGHGAVQRLILTPSTTSLAVGGTQQFLVSAQYADHSTVDVLEAAQWAVTPANVARITSGGLLTATGAGPFALTVNAGAQSAALLGTVSGASLPAGPAVSALSITPAGATVAAGGAQQFSATATLADGTTADVSSQVSWLSSNTAALAVNAAGLGTASGTADASVVLAATYGGASTLTTVQVKAAAAAAPVTAAATVTALYVQPTSSSIVRGSAERHTALAFYSDGSQQDVTSQVTWGVVGSTAPATTTATQAKPRAVGALRAHAVAGQATTQQAAAAPAATMSDGVIAVDAQGVETALAVGASQVQATLGSMQSTGVVLVDDDVITKLDIRASRDHFPVGGVQPVQLIGTAADGHRQDLSLTANWQSSNPSVATISSSGIAMGVAAGDVTFTASFGGLTASSIGYQVLPKTLLSLRIDAPYTGLPTGGTEQLAVQGTYSDGSTHDLTGRATWASLNPALISATSSGRIFVNGAGTAQITATIDGLQALVAVVGNVDPVSSVDVLPRRPRLAKGTTLRLSALSHFSSGAQVNTADEAIWTVLDPTVATVNSFGLLRSGSAGTTTVTARAFGVLTTNPRVEVTDATLVRLVLQAPVNQLAEGTPQQYTALGVFSDGSFQNITADVTWSSSDFTKASIDATGLARAIQPATVQITAAFQGVTASLPLTITDATVTSVAITPGNSELPAYVARQYSLIATFSDGTTQDLTPFAVWSAGVPYIASTLLKGEVLAINPGVGEITAQYGFFSASTQVNVTGATLTSMVESPASTMIRLGQRQPMTVIGTFSDGYTQDMYLNVDYDSANPDVASILDMQGVVNATGIGATQISATYRGITATTTQFRVTSNVLQSIAFNPSAPSVASGATTQLQANGTFDDGVVYDLSKEVTWTSSNPAVLTIDSNGRATAATVGVATRVTVTVAFGGSTASFYVTVMPPATSVSGGDGGGNSGGGSGGGSGTTAPLLTGIAVVPTSAHLAAGTQVQLTVLGTYSDGVRRDVSASSAWSTDTPAAATVSGTGLVTAVAPGMAQVQAQVGSFTAASTVNVSSATLVSVAIQAGSTPLGAGSSQQFALIGTFSDGSQQNLSSGATWTSSNGAVATVSTMGLVTGVSTGSVRILATFLGETATTASFAVGAAQPVSLQITPASPSFAAGTAQMFHVIATYADGSTQDVTAAARFVSSNPGVVRLDGGGTATGIRPGSAQLTVTFAGLSASTQTVRVTNATLVSLAVTPPNPQFALGTNQQFTVIGTFSDGSTQNLTATAVWASSNPAVLTIDGNGLATSVSTGSAQVSATLNGVTGTSGSVRVTPATLASISLMPAHPTVAAGTDVQVSVVGHFSDGSTQDLTESATFTSSNSTVLTAGTHGLLHGVSSGTANLTITANGTTQTSSVTVSNAALVSLTIAPANPVPFAKGTSEQFTVTGTFSDGTMQDLSSSATWTSSDALVVTVDSHGSALGVGVGSAALSVSYQGQTAMSGSVQVTPATATSLSLSPAHASIMAGTTQQFTATVTNSDGSTQNVTNTATWSSTNTAVAMVSSTGLATGNGAGNSTIAAQWNGLSSTANLAVAAASVTLQSVTVTPASGSVAAGATLQFHATGTNSDGTTQDLTSTVAWTSSNTAVATVNASGLATGTAAGSSTITAVGNGVSGSASVTVTTGSTPGPVTLQSIALTPSSGSIATGSTLQFHANGAYSDGTTQDLTNMLTWTASNSSVAMVNATGLATGTAAGSSTITASGNGLSGSANLTVTAGSTPGPVTLQSIALTPSSGSIATGSTLQFHASGTYSDGTIQDLTNTLTWTTSNPAVAMVNATGLATGTAAGSSTITASGNGLSGSANLTVSGGTNPTPVTLQSIALTPSSGAIASGSTVQFHASGTYSDGTTQDLTNTVNWTTSSAVRITINASGLATANAAGTGSISAQANGVSATANLTITANPTAATLQLIAVTPASSTLAYGGTEQFHATGTYTDGSMQDITASVVWTSSSTNVATISSTGLAQAVATGNATITATGNGINGSTSVTVGAAPLVTITVRPANASLAAGTTQQYTAVGQWADGSTQDLTNTATWTSSSTPIATVNASGLLTAHGQGSSTIAAQSGSVSGMATVTVTPATVVALAVSPSPVSIAAGGVQTITVIANFSDGTSQDVSGSATYTSSNPGVATVTATGTLQASGTGSATVQVSLNSFNTTLNVTVTPATLIGIALTPANISLAAGMSQQFTATGSFSDGSTQDLTSSLAWATSAQAVATVNNTGDMTVLQGGQVTLTATSSSGVAGSITLTTTNAVVTTIAVTPAAVNLAAGQSQQFAATATLSDGSQQTVTGSVHWSAPNTTSATVSNSAGSAGLLSTTATGNVTVTATMNGISGQASVVVMPAQLSSLTLAPNPLSLPAGTTAALTVSGTYTDGTTANLTGAATYSVDNVWFATVDADGTVHARGTGSTVIHATVQGISGSVAETTTAATLTGMTLTPLSPSIAAGLLLQLHVQGSYSDSSTADLSGQVQWGSSDATVATVTAAGSVHALRSGMTTITAALNGTVRTVPLVVTTATLQTIAVNASSHTVASGLSVQLAAVGTYTDGSTHDLTSSVSWTSQTPSIGLVSSTGVANGLRPGSFTAAATLNGIQGTGTITVTAPVLQAITITPDNTTVVNLLSHSVQYVATGSYSDGSTRNLTNSVQWTITSGIALGTLTTSGRFSPLGVGAGTISATAGSVTKTTGFTVISAI